MYNQPNGQELHSFSYATVSIIATAVATAVAVFFVVVDVILISPVFFLPFV